ncbi:MAG: hypothetical protein H6862_06525 [Rhodospirillales bacterium]|nr:hypothetical protein [Rhodospirillales bacterium]
MSFLNDELRIASQIQSDLERLCADPDRGFDGMKMLSVLSGFLVETLLLFDNPEDAMEGAYARLAFEIGCEPYDGEMDARAVPPAHILDSDSECGKALARCAFEDWLDCGYAFHDLAIQILARNILAWEEWGFRRAETFRILIESTNRVMGFELAAQELCDIAIAEKMEIERWSIADAIAALSAIAGRRLALSLHAGQGAFFRGIDLPMHLDHIAYVMTQEATRQGIPAGSDWRFGLAANDTPVNAPLFLVRGIEPAARMFFRIANIRDLGDQAVGCAKAAGRMIALAASGEIPRIEPVIVKPLAMAAMTETYKSVCMESAVASS